jgi:hypothetical protein
MAKQPSPPASRLPPLSDEYCLLLIATGPALAFCALGLWLVEWGVSRPDLLPVLPIVYWWFLLTALPGLLPLAYCLSRAWPRRPAPVRLGRCLAWFVASLPAPLWHLAIIELALWLFGARSWFGWSGWLLFARYGFGLWVVTVLVWVLYVAVWRWRQGDVPRDAIFTGPIPAPVEVPLTPVADTYRVLALAAGPGLVWVLAYWYGEGRLARGDFLAVPGAYLLLLFGCLPGLLALSFCLARALPRERRTVPLAWRIVWGAAALPALFWHLVIIEGAGWLVEGNSPLGWSGWSLCLRYGLVLGGLTLVMWVLCVAVWRWRGDRRSLP